MRACSHGAPQTFSLTPEECFGAANPDLGPARIPLESCPPGLEAGMKVRLATGAKAAVTAVVVGSRESRQRSG